MKKWLGFILVCCMVVCGNAVVIAAKKEISAKKETKSISKKGLVAYWSFDDGKGTIAKDLSGNNNNGKLVNMDPSTCWVEGKKGKALYFDGVDDYVNCGNVAEWNLASTNHSIEMWFKIPPRATYSTAYPFLLCRYVSSTGYYMFTSTRSNVVSVREFGGSNISILGPTTLIDDNWHHIAYTVDTNTKTAYLYIDGSQYGTITYTGDLADADVNLSIGRGSDAYSVGGIDEVAIYNRALSKEEIKAHYESITK